MRSRSSVVGYVLAVLASWSCGGHERSGGTPSDAAGAAGSDAHAQAGTGATMAASGGGGMSTVAGQASTGGETSASGETSAPVGQAGSVGQAGTTTGGAPACVFDSPQCPVTGAPCESLGQVQNCFFWQTCHSAPGQVICCRSGWEPGSTCPNEGAGGDGADACGGCDAQAREVCIYQVGGPGPGHFRCAVQQPCKAASLCACIVGQGTCQPAAAGDPAGYCVCDNGLE